MKNIIDHLSSLIGEKIIHHKPVSGGDISSTFILKTSTASYFLKLNSKKSALAMFLTEKKGLETIAKTHTIATPKVFFCDQFKNDAFLLMEFIETKIPDSNDYETLANQLADLHKTTTSEFGLKHDNFIGSLTQSNKQNKNWTKFYLNERIVPQLVLAQSKKLLSSSEVPKMQHILLFFESIFHDITPSLLHGDLWSGNYLIAQNGTPYLIDPAIYFGHNEIDIAMSKLFGGFSPSFYQTYEKHYPSSENTNIRIDIYQLYYLLVHLNLFGSSYYKSVKRILTNYF